MMYSFQDVIDEIKFQLRYRVPEELAIQQAIRSLRRFANKSSCIREHKVFDSIDECGKVIVTSSTDGVVHSVLNVRFNGGLVPLSSYRYTSSNGELQFLTSGSKNAKVELDASVTPVPDKSSPADSFLDVPAEFFDLYGEGIAAHACYKLSMNQNEPWADPSRVADFKNEFDMAIKRSITRNNKPFRLSL